MTPFIKTRHYKNFPEDLGKFLKTYPDLDDILKLPLFRGLRLLIGTDTSNAKSFFDIVPILRNLCVDVPKYNQYDEDDEDNLMMDYMGQQKSNKGKPTFGDAFNEYNFFLFLISDTWKNKEKRE